MVYDLLPDVSGTAVFLRPGDDIRSIVDASPEGQVFVLTAGLYRSPTITPKDNQTFIGEDGAVMSGAVAVTGWSREGDLWSAAGFPAAGWSHGDGRDGVAALTEDLFIDGVPLLRVASLAEVTEGTFHYDGERVYTGTDPTGKTVEASATQVAFAGEATTGVTLINLRITQYASPAQHGAIEAHRTTNWTLIDIEATGNHGAGVSAGDGTKILGGVYSRNGQVGIHAYDTTGLVIDAVTASGNNFAGFSQTWDAGGIKILTSDDVTVRNSEIAANAGMGLWLDWDNRNVAIENNLVRDNAYLGIFYEASYDAVISGNTVGDNNRNGYTTGYWGSDIYATSSDGISVTGNLVVSSIGQGIGLEQSPRADGAHGAHALRDAAVTGNTIVMTGEGMNGVAGAVESVIWDGNTYVAKEAGDLRFTWEDRYLRGTAELAGSEMDAASRFLYRPDLSSFADAGFLTTGFADYDVSSGESLAIATRIGTAVTGTLGTEALLLAGPANGTVSLSASGSFTYTPAAGFSGTDSFRYFAIDAQGDGSIGLAKVTVAPDTLVLRVAGDSWVGDPRFDVTVDGVVYRGLGTSASHARGEWEEITLTGDFGTGDSGAGDLGGRPDSVSVTFTNDAWGGPGKDRNLYLRDLTVNGETHDAATATSTGHAASNVAHLVTNGTLTFDTSEAADVLILRVAGDSHAGDPEFRLSVNGGPAQTFTASASRAAGEWQEIVLRGTLGPDDAVSARIEFVNDAWEGAGRDRNLYIGEITYNGHEVSAVHEGSVEILDDALLLPRNDGLTFLL